MKQEAFVARLVDATTEGALDWQRGEDGEMIAHVDADRALLLDKAALLVTDEREGYRSAIATQNLGDLYEAARGQAILDDILNTIVANSGQ